LTRKKKLIAYLRSTGGEYYGGAKFAFIEAGTIHGMQSLEDKIKGLGVSRDRRETSLLLSGSVINFTTCPV